jgi:putative hemolysin
LNYIIQIIVLIILLSLSAFFSSAETALTTVNRIRIQSLADDGDRRASVVLKVIDNKAKMLSAVLIGNNVVNIAASSLATTLAIAVFGSMFVGLVTGILTLLILIFGEITPKNMATVNAEKIALDDAGIIRFLMFILTPVIFVINKISRFIVRALGVDPDRRNTMTENELRTLVDVSHEDGVIENEERQIINNVVDLGDTTASEIMIPRIDMTSVSITEKYRELITLFKEHRFTRLPVYSGSTDNVVGILNMKDLLFVEDAEKFSVKDYMKEPYFTFEQKSISSLLEEMRLNSLSIVVVLDEYGAASGIITMEDILEEIVGDIRDEYKGRDAQEITEIVPNREYSCLGSANLDDVNEMTGLELDSEEYDSIGGYVIEHSQDNLPKVGEYVISEDGTKLIVEAVHKNRVMRVHLYLPEPKNENGDDDERHASAQS